jgi:UDP-N-acetylglucosamine--N-acetylmuramyl-(pentapeptide) pyrophosphoryl-undecaprenol N-acetylglucosamine transferase
LVFLNTEKKRKLYTYMKIVFTGGGTGGHFYPIIAVAEALRAIADEEKILDLQLYYYSNSPYDVDALFEQGIEFVSIASGKQKIYASFSNFLDMFKTGYGIIEALFSLFFLYPDVIFSKGGYASFPVVFAARILRIPVVIHDSDSIPGRVNIWAGKFAKRIALSYDEAASYFPKATVAVTGQPVREIIREKKPEGAFEYLKLDHTIPTILVLGGSLGAEAINNAILDDLEDLVQNYQIVHQTGKDHFKEVSARATVMLQLNPNKSRYVPFPFLNPLAIKMASGAAWIVITRAGSSLFEVASWGIPAIVIPIPKKISRDQESNAFSYARRGGAVVIEQDNLSQKVLLAEVERFRTDTARYQKMALAAKATATPEASKIIARSLLDLSLEHED